MLRLELERKPEAEGRSQVLIDVHDRASGGDGAVARPHREAVDDLADALETEPAGESDTTTPGISNRESAPADSPPPAHPVDGAFGREQQRR
ncbi:MAG TPA: hypothetical protein VG871_03910 [Vicinamibacterales bacterium]|nr:hypothetical protein [Vicinamibacterales bacterium]